MIFIKIGLAVFMAVSPFLSSDKNGKATLSALLPTAATDDHDRLNPQSAGNRKHKAIHSSSSLSPQKIYISQNENRLHQVIREQIKNHQKGAQSQKKVSALAEETGDLVNEYEITLRQIENTRSYNEQLKKLIQDQTNEMKSIRIQIGEVKQTGKDILPFMLEMTDNLAKKVD